MSANKTLDVYYKNKHVGTLAEMVDSGRQHLPAFLKLISEHRLVIMKRS